MLATEEDIILHLELALIQPLMLWLGGKTEMISELLSMVILMSS
jgi:hypothetical protein